MSNRHKIIATILIAVILSVSLTLIMLAINSNNVDGGNYQETGTFMYTNQFVVTMIIQTATAKAYTATPTPTQSPLYRLSF